MNTFRLSSRARPRHNHDVKVCSNRESVRLRTQANITGHWYSQRRHNHAYSTMYTPSLRWQRMMSCIKEWVICVSRRAVADQVASGIIGDLAVVVEHRPEFLSVSAI